MWLGMNVSQRRNEKLRNSSFAEVGVVTDRYDPEQACQRKLELRGAHLVR
jgi:hypothetical protein